MYCLTIPCSENTKIDTGYIVNSAFRNLLIGCMSVAALSIIGCSPTADTNEAYVPPPNAKVVDVPTGVTTVPPATSSVTSTTQYPNGDVQQRTTTAYVPGYSTADGYRTTVVPNPSVPNSRTTRSTTTDSQGNVVQQQTTTTTPGY